MLRNLCVFIFLSLLLFSGRAQCTGSSRVNVLVKTLAHVHLKPVENSSENGERILESFFLNIDPYRVFYSQKDIESLTKYGTAFLDTLSFSTCAFLDDMLILHKQRTQNFSKELESLLSKPIVLLKNDSLTIGFGSIRKFEVDETGRINRLKKFIRYRFLLAAVDLDNNENLSEVIKKNDTQMRETLKSDLECEIHPVAKFKDDQDYREFLLNDLLEAIASIYDPHTAYFDMQSKNEFQTKLSSDGRTFGIFVSENEKGEKVIDGLLPGSYAWKQNRINVGDKIVSVYLDNSKTSNFRCIDSAELEAMMDNSNFNTMDLEVEKSSGERIHVMLRKEVARVDENVINGLIFQDDNSMAGYISLPAFYSSGSFYVDKGCANDVGKEILKMKQAGINGLILDLRDNGGGDLGEAMDLAGLFIDVGPLGMVVERNGKPTILKEMNKGVVYDGPMIVLVNGFSASASEVLAAVLQDYNRALIVGSPTYGKSTAQRMFPLLPGNGGDKPFAYVKATNGMLYRITGNTHQKKGVVPQIMLHDVYAQLGITEASMEGALEGSFVDKTLLYKKFPDFPLDALRERNANRINESEYEKYLNANKNRWLKKEYVIHLDPTVFASELKKPDAFNSLDNELKSKLKCPFQVKLLNNDLVQMDSYLNQLYEAQKEMIQEDAELQETFQILTDLIFLQKK